MEQNRSIQTINNETNNLQEQLGRLEQDNNKLEKELCLKDKVIELCKDPKKSKAIVEENVHLKQEIESLIRRLDTDKEIINRMGQSLENIRNESKPDLNNEQLVELYNQGLPILKIAQLCETTKKSVLDILIEMGKYKPEQEDGYDKRKNSAKSIK